MKISYSLLSRIDHDAFLSDTFSLPLFTDQFDNIDELLSQYNSGLSTLLETHAPVLTKSIASRPSNPWLTDDGLTARRKARKLERLWCHKKKFGTDLVVDRQIMLAAFKKKRKLLGREKASYLNKEIAESTGKKSLFKIVDPLLIKKPGLKLPCHDSPRPLANQFGEFFSKKVSDIRKKISKLLGAVIRRPKCHYAFLPSQFFHQVTASEIVSLIMNSPPKSFLRDPIPTSLLRKFVDYLAVPISAIVNLSLSRGVFPDEIKLALVTPLLKKPSLCPDDLNNYRPVSLLSFLLKLVERVGCKQDVTDHHYADDVQYYVTFSLDLGHATQLRAFSSLSSCVGETKTWMTENLIKFNESKTYAIIVYSKLSRRKPATVPLSIGNAAILPSDYVRNHGVIIDKHLSMEKHINNTRRVALYHLKKIAKVRKFLTLPAASQLISALVLLHIDYGNRYWLVYLPRISIVTNPASPAVKRVN